MWWSLEQAGFLHYFLMWAGHLCRLKKHVNLFSEYKWLIYLLKAKFIILHLWRTEVWNECLDWSQGVGRAMFLLRTLESVSLAFPVAQFPHLQSQAHCISDFLPHSHFPPTLLLRTFVIMLGSPCVVVTKYHGPGALQMAVFLLCVNMVERIMTFKCI